MKPETVAAFVTGLKEAGINFVATLPSTGVAPIIRGIEADPDFKGNLSFKHVPVCNEADGVCMCAGAWMGGKKAALVAENTAAVLSAYALMGLWGSFGGFSMLLVLEHRGDFGDGAAYWYTSGGHVTPKVLDALMIPYTIVYEPSKLKTEIQRGQNTAESSGKPAAVLFSGEEALW